MKKEKKNSGVDMKDGGRVWIFRVMFFHLEKYKYITPKYESSLCWNQSSFMVLLGTSWMEAEYYFVIGHSPFN
jgi:hypothetical protein